MSKDSESAALATLAAWRERGDDRLDPVRFRLIEAMARRSLAHGGETRRILDERLSGLIAAYASKIGHAGSAAIALQADADASELPAPGPLAELIAHIGNPLPPAHHSAASDAAPRPAGYPELPVIDYFRETWAKVSANRQVRQSQEHVPENAGPLNSNNLVHRSLSVMRDLSPGYLRQFLSYIDALSWMEQLNGAGMPTKDAARSTGAKKGARGKAR